MIALIDWEKIMKFGGADVLSRNLKDLSIETNDFCNVGL